MEALATELQQVRLQLRALCKKSVKARPRPEAAAKRALRRPPEERKAVRKERAPAPVEPEPAQKEDLAAELAQIGDALQTLFQASEALPLPDLSSTPEDEHGE